jgi:DNA-binding PadR family transcriptional regulator
MVHRLRQRLMAKLAPPTVGGGRFFGLGEIRLAVLSLLGDAPAHGYELMKLLTARCGGSYRPSAGVMYPTLQLLADEGLVEVDTSSPSKRVFSLTAEGRAEAREHAAEIEAIWRRAESWSEWDVLDHPQAAEVLGPAMRLAKAAAKAVVKSLGDPEVIEAIREIFDDARTRIERLHRKARR